MMRKNTRKFSRQNLLVLLGVFVAVALFSFLVQTVKKPVDAANLKKFDAGYIISDYQMRNYKSMNEAEIQAFLSSKVECNKDRNYYNYLVNHYSGYSWHFDNGHIICLPEERFGNGETIGSGDTAAHIIWQTAQDYKINPQVLIVLLQKEQGLITDAYPNTVQYRSATGYGCPDTAPCSSEYYGFKNQVRKAAEMFNTVLNGGWTNYPVGWNYIQYSPNDCGGSWVNVRNLATSALYRYTPYQPNAGALAAGYGTAYCGAYGNRNFYAYFEDWFGGITDTKVVWEKMLTPRVMTVNKSTLVIDVREHNTTSTWVEKNESYYFAKKTSIFWGGEKRVCLQRKVDEGTDRCVLMERTSEFSLGQSATKITANEYEITTRTCIVDIIHQSAECNKKTYDVGQVLKFDRQVKIEGNTYLIEVGRNDGFAVLKQRTRRKVYYDKVNKSGAVLMRIVKNTDKYIAGENTKTQSLSSNGFALVFIMDKTTVDGKKYYRTLHDYNKNNNYLIPEDALSEDIFMDFMRPRNMMIKRDTTSINLDTGKTCDKYRAGDIKKYARKTEYAGEIYYQSEKDKSNKCAVKASDLKETIYNFSNSVNIKNKFSDFLYPRNLRIKSGGFAINVVDGTTCDEYMSVEDVQKYTTKITTNGIVFFRTEKNTKDNSTCAVPSASLVEVS